MNTKGNRNIFGREELKKYFRNGNIPNENDFGFLIESMINKQDDGISKDGVDGLLIYKSELSSRLLTFFNQLDETQPFFLIERDDKGTPSLRFHPCDKPEETDDEEGNSFFFHEGGKLGIGKRSDPKYKLDVKGMIGMEGRMGTFRSGSVLADGRWHSILKDLDNCQAFEVIARAGAKGKGKFAMMHAIALSAYGRSKSKIRKTRAHYGFVWNKLNLRWKGDNTHQYHLQLRTNCNYGPNVSIFYSLTKLWDDECMLPAEYSYPKGAE